MLLSELQTLLDTISLPCTYDELVEQCLRYGVSESIIQELKDRFEEQAPEELIYESDFEESDDYFDDEIYHQDD